MKSNRLAYAVSFGLALGALVSTTQGAAAEETVTETKTTTYSGVVSEVNPDSSTIILKSESSPDPVTYTYSKETTFVDSKGNVVTYETIRNSPVTVEYAVVGGNTVVSRVVQTGPVVVAPAAPTIQKKTTTHTETETH